ncbi:hypothetical protein JKF63_06448 [Porcisia hertigi]|uniref:Uncharacterized protein n=1 Tax=Porcisia hertigi TaxID=2761500 RepID=A0A836YJ84_9TRYP|nr:hypothetical protein JKF63_06448 [Porcisia hertigi]
MIDQLMGAGLVQAADLLEFGFSIAELRAAGLNLSSPHHHTDQHAKGGMNTMPARRLSDNSSEVRRKRSWESEATQPQRQQDRRATPSLAVCDTATTALSTKASEVQPANRAVESSAFLSEKARAQSLRAARLVENSQHCVAQNCARSLTYEAMDDEEAAGAASKKRCNTALNFNGLDVAVVKEIAKQLQEEARNDAYVKSRSMREYMESRKDDNTPYM